MNTSTFTLIAIEAALKAGELLREGFHSHFRVESKSGIHNLVTECDNASEKSIISTILKHFPSHSILAEESGASHKQAHEVLWVIDPLDGTVNFAHHIPVFSVSIGVAINEEVHIGVVYNPMSHELFVAEKGKGAHLNGKPLKVTSTHQLMQAFLATGFPYNVDQNPMHCIDTFVCLQSKGLPIRRLGSAALDLAYVAAGRFDAYWELNLSPWDTAAGTLLVAEAGGKVTQYNGSAYRPLSDKTILASNGFLHDMMIEELKMGEEIC